MIYKLITRLIRTIHPPADKLAISITKGLIMHVQAPKGSSFSILIAGALDNDAPSKNVPVGLPIFSNFDASVVSVSDPVANPDETFSATVTVLGDAGTTTVVATMGVISGAITVSVKADAAATKLIITADSSAEVVS